MPKPSVWIRKKGSGSKNSGELQPGADLRDPACFRVIFHEHDEAQPQTVVTCDGAELLRQLWAASQLPRPASPPASTRPRAFPS